MIVTIHASEVTLTIPVRIARGSHRDYTARWEEASFAPLAETYEERPSGAIHRRSASVPVRVSVPTGSRVTDGRLVCYSARLGWDATTLLYVARRGMLGASLAVECDPPARPERAPAARSSPNLQLSLFGSEGPYARR